MMGVFVQLNEAAPTNKSYAYPIGYVICESGCWEWVGYKNPEGYGTWALPGKPSRHAHRVMYEQKFGSLPTTTHLDHLCRKRDCVNPDHLEPVTCKTNVLRGVGLSAENARKTHCQHGHPFDADNTYTAKDGTRHCKACRRVWDRKRYHLAKAAKSLRREPTL